MPTNIVIARHRHDDQRGGRVLRFGRLERRHAVEDRFDAGHRRAAVRERRQQQETVSGTAVERRQRFDRRRDGGRPSGGAKSAHGDQRSISPMKPNVGTAKTRADSRMPRRLASSEDQPRS